MDGRESEQSESLFAQYLEGHISRAQLFKAATAGLALAAIPSAVAAQGQTGASGAGTNMQSFPFFPQVPGRYTTETVTEIVSNLLTAGYLVVTGIATVARSAGTLGIPAVNVNALQASLALRQFEIDFFSSLVPQAKPLTTTITIPPGLTSSTKNLSAMAETVATVQVGIYIAAVREFAELGQPTLAKYAAQALGAQAEARLLTRVARALEGDTTAVPPPNKAFETDLLVYTRDGIALMTARGFINGPGTPVTYPGRDAILALAGATANGVIQRAPNNATTSVTAGSDLTAERP